MSTINSQPGRKTCYHQAPYNPSSVSHLVFISENAPEETKTKMKRLRSRFYILQDALNRQLPTSKGSGFDQAMFTPEAQERRSVMRDYAALSVAEHTRQSTLPDCPGQHCPRHSSNHPFQTSSTDDPDEPAPSNSQTRLGDNETIRQ